MNEYSFESLKTEAESAGLWIDVYDKEIRRGRKSNNTNKKERVSRALSWYDKSETAAADDERLIFAYIAFNALYACDKRPEDNNMREDFFLMLKKGAHSGIILDFACMRLVELRKILSLQHLSSQYWNHTANMRAVEQDRREEIHKANRITQKQISDGDFVPVWKAMRKINLLRNQIIHGMAAYADSYNRTQVKLCADFLHEFTGRAIAVVVRDSTQKWGEVSYPPQGSPDVSSLQILVLAD